MNANKVGQALIGLATLLKDITPVQGKPYTPNHCAIIAQAVEAVANGMTLLIDYVAEKEASMTSLRVGDTTDTAELIAALEKANNECQPVAVASHMQRDEECGTCKCLTCNRPCKRCNTYSALTCFTNTCPNHKVYSPTEWADGK